MKLPWEQTPMYGTVAEAEAAVITAGYYIRDTRRHVWIDEAGRIATVQRNEENLQFFVKWG